MNARKALCVTCVGAALAAALPALADRDWDDRVRARQRASTAPAQQFREPTIRGAYAYHPAPAYRPRVVAPTPHMYAPHVRPPIVVERPVVLERRVVVERPVYVERPAYVAPPVYYSEPQYYNEPTYYGDPAYYGAPAVGAYHSSAAGTIGGAVIGAVIGSQVADHDNRGAGAAIGAILGGIFGSNF